MTDRAGAFNSDHERLSARKDDIALVLSLLGLLLSAGLGVVTAVVLTAFVIGVVLGWVGRQRLLDRSERRRLERAADRKLRRGRR